MPFSSETAISDLTRLVGDLQPASPEQGAALDDARRLVAQAVAAGLAPGPMPSMLPIQSTPELAELLAQPIAEGQGFLVHRRSLPVLVTRTAASLPQWAAGMKIDSSLGPFLDVAGRNTWIDLFRLVRHVRLVRSPASAPFLTLPIEVLLRFATPISRPVPTRYDIPAGSIWFASQLLAAAAPASSYTGLRVTGHRRVPQSGRVLPPHLPHREPESDAGGRGAAPRRPGRRPGGTAADQLRRRQDALDAIPPSPR